MTRNMQIKTLRTLSATVLVLVVATLSAADSFTNVAPTNSAHDQTQAVSLPNGTVLIMGGDVVSPTATTASEIYDPSTNTWTNKASMIAARNSFGAIVLPNGTVLAMGGSPSNVVIGSAEIYTPAANTWTSTGAMISKRASFTTTLLPNGKVLVAGGLGTGAALAACEIYDPATGTWAATGSMSVARYLQIATPLPSGKVLISGGVDNSSTAIAICELYDPVAGTWSNTAQAMNVARKVHNASPLPNGKVLATGGLNASYFTSAELYDPVADTWTLTSQPMAIARCGHIQVTLPSGKVLVAGGRNGSPALASAEIYDPATDTWANTSVPMNATRLFFTATPLPTGDVLLAGGDDGSSSLTSAEVYAIAPGPPTQMIIASGNNQTTTVGSIVPIAPSVTILDALSRPVPNVPVSFAVATGGGSVAGGSATSDSSGTATLGSWTLGTVAGPNSLAVTSPGTPGATFNATATVGPATQMFINAGNNQTSTVGTSVPIAPSVMILDSYNNPVSGAIATFTVTTGGGSVNNPSPVTNSSGIATVNSWTLGTIAGTNSLDVSSPGTSNVTFNATSAPGAPNSMTVSAGNNQSAIVGTNVAIAPAVIVRDFYGNAVSNRSVTFTVSAGGGSIVGGNATTDFTGTATLGSWKLGSVAGNNSLLVSSGALSPVSVNATATAGSVASLSIIAGNGQTAVVNTNVSTAPAVKVADQFNNPIANQMVLFAVVSGGGSVGGASATTNATGVATLGTWTLGQKAGSNSLSATIAGAPSVTFTATGNAGPPALITVVSGNNQSALPGTTLPIAPAVTVGDAFNNIVPAGTPVLFAVTTGGGSITGGNAQTDATGTATLGSWTLGSSSASNTLTVTCFNAPAATITAIAANNSPIITSFVAAPDANSLGTAVTYLISSTDSDSNVLTFVLDFGDGTPPAKGTFAQGTIASALHTFTMGGNYTSTVTVSDGGTTVTQSLVYNVPVPPSTSAGIPNISNNIFPVVNPTDDFGIAIEASNGGIIQLAIDISSLTRSTTDLTTIWGDVSGRSSKSSGSFPVHQYVQHGIFVATSTATDHTTAAVKGMGRKTLVVSSRETGEKSPSIADLKNGRTSVGIAPSQDIALRVMQGKFNYNGKTGDTVSLSSYIQLPSGLDLSQPHEFSVGIGNIVCNTMVDARGVGKLPGTPSVLRNLKIMYPRLGKGALTRGGEKVRVDVTFYMPGLVNLGFDTEGITKTAKDASSDGATVSRKIQVGMLLDGVPYEALIPVQFSNFPSSNFGAISAFGQK